MIAVTWALMLAQPLVGQSSEAFCPNASDVPHLSIDAVMNSPIPLVDTWQVVLNGVAISDAQLADLAGRTAYIDRTREEMESRGTFVYLGTILTAAGTAISSAGWILYGQNTIRQEVTLSLALGGLIVGVGGLVTITQAIQTPLEPHLAPTPQHRLTREEAHELLSLVNQRWYNQVCNATKYSLKNAPKDTRVTDSRAP